MDIRKLTEKDWDSFRALRLEALKLSPEAFGSSYEEESILNNEDFQHGFKNCDMFGAFIHNQIAGCAGFFIHSSKKSNHRGQIIAMYTRSDFRHHGIGDALLKMIIKHAAKHVLQLHLTVVTSNQPAIALYQKNGFKIYGTEPRSLKIDTFFYDEHFMIMEYPEQVTSQQNTQNH